MEASSPTFEPGPDAEGAAAVLPVGGGLDLDSFLTHLRSAGATESSGAFTLDPAQVRRKLRQYQLAEPHYYLAPLLSSAYLGGANVIEVQVDYGKVSLQWDGQPVQKSDLEGLFTTLLVGAIESDQRRLRELAVGLNAALALRPRRLRVSSGEWAMDLSSGGEKVYALQAPVVGTLLELEHGPWRSLQRNCRARLLGRLPEQRVVEDHCAFAAPHLRVNGREVPLPALSPGCLASALVKGGSPTREAMLMQSLPQAPVRREVRGAGPHSALLTLHKPGSSNLGLRVVLDGVMFSLPRYDLGVPGTACLVVAPQLVKNLSSSEMVANDDWIRLYNGLRGEAFALAQALVEGWNQLSTAQRRQAVPALQALTRFHLRRRDPEQARQATRRVLSLFEQSGGPRDRAYADAVYSALLLQRETSQAESYRSGMQDFVSWLAPLLGVRVRPTDMGYSGLMAVDFRLEGEKAAVEQAHRFLLSVEHRVLGTEHVVTVERLEALRRLYSLWGWEKKLPPLMARLHRHIDQAFVPSLSDQSRYWG